MTNTLLGRIVSEHIKREVRGFEKQHEYVDSENYLLGEDIIEPVIKEGLIDRASQYLRTFVSKVKEEGQYELGIPMITPYEGGIDFFWDIKNGTKFTGLLHVDTDGDASYSYHINGKIKNGVLI